MPPRPMDFVTIDFEEPFQLEAGKFTVLKKFTQKVISQLVFLGNACNFDSVKVIESQTHTQKAKVCGEEKPSSVLSRGETLVQFKSDRSITAQGFHIRYTIQPCGGVITEDFAEIKSPTHLNGYMHNLNCTWTIQAPAGQVVELKFNSLEMEIHSRCNYDYVAAFHGDSISANDEIGRYCGNQTTVPPVLKSRSNIMTVQFKTDRSISAGG